MLVGLRSGPDADGASKSTSCQKLMRAPRSMLRALFAVPPLWPKPPSCSGVETLHALKAAGKSVRVIILTNYETDEDIYRAVQAGAQGYLLNYD